MGYGNAGSQEPYQSNAHRRSEQTDYGFRRFETSLDLRKLCPRLLSHQKGVNVDFFF